jgi:hypothetical protein
MLSSMRCSIGHRLVRSARWQLSARAVHRSPIGHDLAQDLARSAVSKGLFGLTDLKKTTQKVRKMSEKERQALVTAINEHNGGNKASAKQASKGKSQLQQRKDNGQKKQQEAQLKEQSKHNEHVKSIRMSLKELHDPLSYFEESLRERYKKPHFSELPDLRHNNGVCTVYKGEGKLIRWSTEPVKYIRGLGLEVDLETQQLPNGTYRSKVVVFKEQSQRNKRHNPSRTKGEQANEKYYELWAYSEVEALGDGRTTVYSCLEYG